MVGKIILILAAVVLVFLAVILIRAARFKPKAELTSSLEDVFLDESRIVWDMQEMIRCKTISYNDESLVDQKEFEKFQKLLPKLYPSVHETCERIMLGVNGMLYCWKGRKEGDPIVLMLSLIHI